MKKFGREFGMGESSLSTSVYGYDIGPWARDPFPESSRDLASTTGGGLDMTLT